MELLQREQYLYQPYYCEENIWQLCRRSQFLDSSYAVIIAAQGEYFPMLQQREAESPEVPLLWDYHVILLWRTESGTHYVLDFDTRLPFCSPAMHYFRQSLLNEAYLKPEMVPLFRLVPAREYAGFFLSDRRHMKTADGWLAEPPKWQPISNTLSNLGQFTDMADDEFGQVLTAGQLWQYLSRDDVDAISRVPVKTVGWLEFPLRSEGGVPA